MAPRGHVDVQFCFFVINDFLGVVKQRPAALVVESFAMKLYEFCCDAGSLL